MGLGKSGSSLPEPPPRLVRAEVPLWKETAGKAEWDNEISSGIQYVRGKLNAMKEYKKLGAGGSVGRLISFPRPERHPSLMRMVNYLWYFWLVVLYSPYAYPRGGP